MIICLCKIGQPTEVIQAIPPTLSLVCSKCARAHHAYLRLVSVFAEAHYCRCSSMRTHVVLFPTIGSDQEANPVFLPGGFDTHKMRSSSLRRVGCNDSH